MNDEQFLELPEPCVSHRALIELGKRMQSRIMDLARWEPRVGFIYDGPGQDIGCVVRVNEKTLKYARNPGATVDEIADRVRRNLAKYIRDNTRVRL